jgi:hypothetical protein
MVEWGSIAGHRVILKASVILKYEGDVVDALVEKLDARLRQWKPETAAQVRQQVAEVIELADHDVLDLMRSRAAEQEVLDLLDEPTTR